LTFRSIPPISPPTPGAARYGTGFAQPHPVGMRSAAGFGG